MKNREFWVTMLVFIMLLSNSFADSVPGVEQVQWQNAGLYRCSPTVADTVFQVTLMPGADWDAKIDTAIARAKSFIDLDTSKWAIIYFPEGTYTLNETIQLLPIHQKIIFQGASSSSTILKFAFNSSTPNCFEVIGYETTPRKALADPLNKGSLSINCTENIGYIMQIPGFESKIYITL